jgi:hypothetical protein
LSGLTKALALFLFTGRMDFLVIENIAMGVFVFDQSVDLKAK